MNGSDVTVVRIYLNEGKSQLERLLKRLHDLEKVRGVTVLRGIAGFGPDGEIHTSRMVDLSFDLPVIVEFFDTPEKVQTILDHLAPDIKKGHMLKWDAQVND